VVYLPIGKKGILVLIGGTGEYKVRVGTESETLCELFFADNA